MAISPTRLGRKPERNGRNERNTYNDRDMKYIDADKLKAEIKRLANVNKQCGSRPFTEGIAAGYADVLCFLDTLPEQPELTIMTNERLEKEAVTFCFDRGITIRLGQAKEFAHHFYKLGLNSKE